MTQMRMEEEEVGGGGRGGGIALEQLPHVHRE